MTTISEEFLALAALIEKNGAAAAIEKCLAQLRQACAKTQASASSQNVQLALNRVRLALETWQSVWPRLGLQPEFRQAVVRESRMWSNRFAQLLRGRKPL